MYGNMSVIEEDAAFMEAYQRKLIVGATICSALFIFLHLYKICVKQEYRLYVIRNKRIIQQL